MSQPTATSNTNGTVSLKGTTITYTIDPTRKFRIITSCNNSNAAFNGKNQNGMTVYKNSIVEVEVMITPLPSSIVPTGTTYQVWRSADIGFTWDHTKLEFIEAIPNPLSTDKSVVDVSKIKATVLGQGRLSLHSEVLPPPELRTPKKAPQYFQWNFGGFLWSSGLRNIGKLRFKVISDFYHPTQSPTDIVAVATDSKIDGGMTVGTNVIGDIQNNANKIQSGPSPEYKVSMSLVPPTTKVKVGDTVPVRVIVSPETNPQVIWSVCTTFAWDPTKLEFMGIDKTGSKPSMSSSIMTGYSTINESSVPKDGNAQHTWLSVLGDKAPIANSAQIVTLNFKTVSEFIDTAVEILQTNDPRLSGLVIMDDTGVYGSCVAGSFVTGKMTNATIKGVLST
jgi:hypothetical protein